MIIEFIILGVIIGFLLIIISIKLERKKYQKKVGKILKEAIDDINKVRSEK